MQHQFQDVREVGKVGAASGYLEGVAAQAGEGKEDRPAHDSIRGHQVVSLNQMHTDRVMQVHVQTRYTYKALAERSSHWELPDLDSTDDQQWYAKLVYIAYKTKTTF